MSELHCGEALSCPRPSLLHPRKKAETNINSKGFIFLREVETVRAVEQVCLVIPHFPPLHALLHLPPCNDLRAARGLCGG